MKRLLNLTKYQQSRTRESRVIASAIKYVVNNYNVDQTIRLNAKHIDHSSRNINFTDIDDNMLIAPQTPIGLKNLGATCYLNVLIQCLFHNPIIRSCVYALRLDQMDNSIKMIQIMKCLQIAFGHMQYSIEKEYSLTDFVSLLGEQLLFSAVCICDI